MSEFIKFIFNESHWLISGPMLTFLALFAIPAYRQVYKSGDDRKKWTGYMQADSLKALYAKLMGDRLNWLDAKWSTPETNNNAPPCQGGMELWPDELGHAYGCGLSDNVYDRAMDFHGPG